MSLIATLSVAKRMPQRMIGKLLEGLYGLHISVGEINEVLHRVSEWSKPTVLQILRSVRGSPQANSDETGWRQPGSRLFLQVDLSGLPADAPADRRTCSGWVGIRGVL